MRIRLFRKKKRMKGLPKKFDNEDIRNYVEQRNIEALKKAGKLDGIKLH